MSTPAPAPKPGPVIVPAVSRRETIIAFASGLGVLGLLVYGVLQMGDGQQKASSNTLTGKVVGRSFTPLKEEVIAFGRNGLKSHQSAGEYILKVRVPSENRVFEVPVDGNTYEAVLDGASFSFMRPHSEQKKVAK